MYDFIHNMSSSRIKLCIISNIFCIFVIYLCSYVLYIPYIIILCADIILSHFIRSLDDNIMSIVSLFIIYSSSRSSLFLLRTLKCIKSYTFIRETNVFTVMWTIKYIIFRVQYTCTYT